MTEKKKETVRESKGDRAHTESYYSEVSLIYCPSEQYIYLRDYIIKLLDLIIRLMLLSVDNGIITLEHQNNLPTILR